MEVEILNFYSILYFVGAQTLCAPNHFKWKYLNWIPIIVHFTLSGFCLYHLSYLEITFLSIVDWLSHILTSISVLPSILIIISNILSKYKVQNILNMLFNLKMDIEKQFGTELSYTQFKRRHNSKIFILLSIFISNVICRIVIHSAYVKKTADVALLITHFFNDMFVLYFVFHIDLLHFIIQFMNTNLNRVTKLKSLNGMQRVELINYITLIHRRIWTIKSVIENRFVWIIMVMLFKSFIHIMINVYWFFRLMIIYHGIVYGVLRKYLIHIPFITLLL